MRDRLLGTGDGSIATIIVETGPNYAHAMIAANRDGEVCFIDPQVGSTVTLHDTVSMRAGFVRDY